VADVASAAFRARARRPLSSFETWPAWLFYAPLPFLWLYLGVRHRGLTLPTIVNTQRAFSGYLGESKSEGLALLGPKGRAHVAPYIGFVTGETNAESERRAAEAMASAGLDFPVVVKPDVGQNGAGVMIVRDARALARWLAHFPRNMKAILQALVEHDNEAGVFYFRRPDAERGSIASLTLKYLPQVRGDGMSTLRELILRDFRAHHLAEVYFARNKYRLDWVIPEGQRVRLVSVGNHCKGAIFKNGAANVTPRMEASFDAIAREIPGFHFGRFDVKFQSLGDLQRGERFSILEINGGDAEMTHIWDADETLGGAYGALFRQYRLAFEIGAQNRAAGARPATVRAFLAAWLRNRARLQRYCAEE